MSVRSAFKMIENEPMNELFVYVRLIVSLTAVACTLAFAELKFRQVKSVLSCCHRESP